MNMVPRCGWLTLLCYQIFFWISSRIIWNIVFIRKSDSDAHGTAESLTLMCKYDTAVTLNLIFEWLWLPLKGISIQKIFIGKLSCTTPITFTQKIWGLTRDRILSQRCHWHYCDENRRFHSLFSPRIRSHIQKGFNPCIRGLGELFDEKNRGQ
jgi:hypothetical protein